MKIITFNVKMPPFSLNKAYYKNRQLTQDARTWRWSFFEKLMTEEIQTAFRDLRSSFNRDSDCFHCHYTFNIPEDKILTKQGTLSARGGDVDNCIKLVQDNLFERRYNDRELDNGRLFKNINIDDKYISRVVAEKRVATTDEYSIDIMIKILPFA